MFGHLSHDSGVVRRVGDNRDVGVVLRRRANHRRAADVDVLDTRGGIGASGDGFFERIEIDDDEVDVLDAVRGHRLDVRGGVAQRQDAAVHLRVQRLHPSVHHLGKVGVVGDLANRDTGPGQRPRRAAGRNNLDAQAIEEVAKFHKAGLIGDGNQRAPDRTG